MRILWILTLLLASPLHAETLTLRDAARQRTVPIMIYAPDTACAPHCKVALINPGYGGSADGYGFLASALTARGYRVIGVQHDLPEDAPMPLEGNIYLARSPYWRTGAETLSFLLRVLPARYPDADWSQVTLIGHSNGGDISAWFARHHPERVAALITLDHRRYPLPREAQPRTLTIRSSDQIADPGVLPDADEARRAGTCVVALKDARHNDMHDGGPAALRERIQAAVVAFVQGRCAAADAGSPH